MAKVDARPLSGFLELSPSEQAYFDYLRGVILDEQRLRGFAVIDTPLIYRNEVLLAKAGGETEKQIYEISRDGKPTGEAIRFDLTVPLSAYTVNQQNNIVFPFKAAQIAKSYRGEHAAAGRYREFYQADADVIGRGSLDLAYDAEIIGLVRDIWHRLDLGDFTIRVSNRLLLAGFLESRGLTEKSAEISGLIDKAEKIGHEKFSAALEKLGLATGDKEAILAFTKPGESNDETLASLASLVSGNDEYAAGLDQICALLDQTGSENIIIDPGIVRGLDYYTGMVFETRLADLPELGSVASGGRYENLADAYSGDKFPGVGGSIGLTRLFAGLKAAGKLPADGGGLVDILVIPFGPEQHGAASELAQRFRNDDQVADVLYSDWKFGKKMNYADKSGAEHIVVVGEAEVASGVYKIKDMRTGAEREFKWAKN